MMPVGGTMRQQTGRMTSELVTAVACTEEPQYLHLTPRQSVHVHGWLKPKRTLHWDDVRNNQSISLQTLMDSGLTAEDLKKLQPAVKEWITHKQVSLSHVSKMLAWPLHPVKHLGANIGDLATMHYPTAVLRRLGITYTFMRDAMAMSDDWMRMLRYTPAEWAELSFEKVHALEMGEKRVMSVFSLSLDALVMKVASHTIPAWQ
jgi:hypothetical protein